MVWTYYILEHYNNYYKVAYTWSFDKYNIDGVFEFDLDKPNEDYGWKLIKQSASDESRYVAMSLAGRLIYKIQNGEQIKDGINIIYCG